MVSRVGQLYVWIYPQQSQSWWRTLETHCDEIFHMSVQLILCPEICTFLIFMDKRDAYSCHPISDNQS